MNQGFPANPPKGDGISCGPVVVSVDEFDAGDWVRWVRCDQVISRWRELHSGVATEDLGSISMSMVERACDGGVRVHCSTGALSFEESCV